MLAKLTAGRRAGPVCLTARRAVAHRVMAEADLDPASGRARLSYEMAEQLFKRYSGSKTLHQLLCVPTTSSTSCDQPIFVDHATDVSVFSDAVQIEID